MVKNQYIPRSYNLTKTPSPIQGEGLVVQTASVMGCVGRRRRLFPEREAKAEGMSFVVAIVGRPNVGKSTLFNRLVGRRAALVHDQPGVTRDRREGQADIGGLTFTVIDTAGLEEADSDTLKGRACTQAWKAVAGADVVLMLIDARTGITPVDRHFANVLRRGTTPVVLVANKCEGTVGQAGLWEAYALGLGEPVPLSAEHGEGMADLIEALIPFHDAKRSPAEKEREGRSSSSSAPLTLAIVGRPNVGKSTLINRLLGEERMITGPEAGITRDAIAVNWTWRGSPLRLVDTAGIRRRTRVVDDLERMAVAGSLEAVNHAQVVALLMDAHALLERQDLTLARRVVDEGRALVVAINKWDMVSDRAAAQERIRMRLAHVLPQVQGVPTVILSARTGEGVARLMQMVFDVYTLWNRRVPTAALNRWLAEVSGQHPPPLGQHGRRIRLRYLTQTGIRPPTFVLFASRPEDLPDSYLRYLVNTLRQTFALPGVPVRLYPRRSENPYA